MKIKIFEEQREELENLWGFFCEGDNWADAIEMIPTLFEDIANRNRGKKPKAEKELRCLLHYNSAGYINKADYKAIFEILLERLGWYCGKRMNADEIFVWLLLQGERQYSENHFGKPSDDELKEWCMGNALEDEETWFDKDDDSDEKMTEGKETVCVA